MDEKRSFGLGVRRNETELEKWRWQSGKEAADCRAFSVTEAAADAVAGPNDVAIAPPKGNNHSACVCVCEGERELEGSTREREMEGKLLSMIPKSGDNSCER